MSHLPIFCYAQVPVAKRTSGAGSLLASSRVVATGTSLNSTKIVTVLPIICPNARAGFHISSYNYAVMRVWLC